MNLSNRSKIILILVLFAIGVDLSFRIQFEYDKSEQESKYFNHWNDISLQRCTFSKWFFRDGDPSYGSKLSNSLTIELQKIENTSLNANGIEIDSIGTYSFDISNNNSFYIYLTSNTGLASGKYSFYSIEENASTFDLRGCNQIWSVDLFPRKIGLTPRFAYYGFKIDIEILYTSTSLTFYGSASIKGEYDHLYPIVEESFTNGSQSFSYSGCCPSISINHNSIYDYAIGKYYLTKMSDLNYYTNPILFISPFIFSIFIIFSIPIFLFIIFIYLSEYFSRRKTKKLN